MLGVAGSCAWAEWWARRKNVSSSARAAGGDTRSSSGATAGAEEGAGGGCVVAGTPEHPGFAAPLQVSLPQGQPGSQLPSPPAPGGRRGPQPCAGQAEIQRRRRAPFTSPALGQLVHPCPPLSGKPCLEVALGPTGPGEAAGARHCGFPGREAEGAGCQAAGPAGRVAQVPGQRAPACACSGPRGRIWAWALFGCAHTCADRRSSGAFRPPLSPAWRELGEQGMEDGRDPESCR